MSAARKEEGVRADLSSSDAGVQIADSVLEEGEVQQLGTRGPPGRVCLNTGLHSNKQA